MFLECYWRKIKGQIKYYIFVCPVYQLAQTFVMTLFTKQQQKKYQNNPLDINRLLTDSKSIVLSCNEQVLNDIHGWIKYLFKGHVYTNILPVDEKNVDLFVLMDGIQLSLNQLKIIFRAMWANTPVLIFEPALLRSINTWCDNKSSAKYRYDVGFLLDYLTAHYDSTRQNYLEKMLNDKNLIISKEQKQRARSCINKIVENHLSKYNNQPIYVPKIGREGVEKVLVVDQSYGDNSIKNGLADATTFKQMLKNAIEENLSADIIIKTHPDTITGSRRGYYIDLKEKDNVYLHTTPINPICMLQYVDKVYVCTSQLGFEALMCGKETHIFGMPFYAGWGGGVWRTNGWTVKDELTVVHWKKYSI